MVRLVWVVRVVWLVRVVRLLSSVVHMPEIKKPVGPGGSREKACRVRAISGSVKTCKFSAGKAFNSLKKSIFSQALFIEL